MAYALRKVNLDDGFFYMYSKQHSWKIVFNYEGDSIECSKAIDAKDAVISNPTLIWVRECYGVPN